MAIESKRWAFRLWFLVIGAFAVLHALHLGADFPNDTPWTLDWAKYTDEGWWANAAVRAHLFGNWYMPGDFNPAPAVPVWPFLEWIVFCFTGVTITAARGLAVAFFFANLALTYALLRSRGPRWMALLAVTLLVTSPFLYCFSRLAILEPMLICLTLAVLNLAIRIHAFRRPIRVSIAIGVLFTLMMLTKTSAVFLLPAIGWAMIAPLWQHRKLALQCALAASAGFAATFALWMALVIHSGLLADYKYLFFVNKYTKPTEFYWPLLSFWWSLRGTMWADRILIPLTGLLLLAMSIAWRSCWSRRLRNDAAFCSSLLAIAGYLLFMTYQNHPQPRYYTVVAFFSFILLALAVQALLSTGEANRAVATNEQSGFKQVSPPRSRPAWKRFGARWLGDAALAAVACAAWLNGQWTLTYAVHPEYTLVPAVEKLTRYIDQHPNGKRLLVSTSGDQITIISHLPTLCDDFGTEDLVSKLRDYQPGWFATWNGLDPGTLEDLHNHYSLEQVASFHALDSPDRNLLVLFKLHPLPGGQVREPSLQNLQIALPGDKIDIPIE